MDLVRQGNRKLGNGVWQTSLSAGVTCPGASSYCELVCYAKAGRYRMANVRDRLMARTELAMDNLPAYEARLRMELCKIGSGIVRIHAAGDFFSRDYILMWSRVAPAFPDITFYAYTRSWNVPSLRGLLDGLRRHRNVTIWASTDHTMPKPPRAWGEAKIFPDAEAAREAGFTVCPEQAGRRETCSDCGLCWRVKRPFKLAFVEH